jgi:hypothetical protein
VFGGTLSMRLSTAVRVRLTHGMQAVMIPWWRTVAAYRTVHLEAIRAILHFHAHIPTS